MVCLAGVVYKIQKGDKRVRKHIVGNPITWYYVVSTLRGIDFIGAVLIPFFMQWGHLTQDKIQFMQTWFWVWTAILDFPTGLLADRISRKASMACGLFLAAAGFTLYGLTRNIRVFLLAEFILACGFSFISGAEDAWLSGTLREQHGGSTRGMSEIKVKASRFSSFARMCTAPMGTLIAMYGGLQAAVLWDAVPLAMAGVIMVLLPEPPRQQRHHVPLLVEARMGATMMWRRKDLFLLAINIALVEVAGYFVIWLYQPLLMSAHISIAYFGVSHALLAGAQFAVSSFLPRLAGVFGSYCRYAAYAALFTALAFAVGAYGVNIYSAFFFMLIGGGFGLTRASAMFEEVSSHMSDEDEQTRGATIRSAMSTGHRACRAAANPFVGALAMHSLRLTLGLLAVLPLIAFLMPHGDKEAE